MSAQLGKKVRLIQPLKVPAADRPQSVLVLLGEGVIHAHDRKACSGRRLGGMEGVLKDQGVFRTSAKPPGGL